MYKEKNAFLIKGISQIFSSKGVFPLSTPAKFQLKSIACKFEMGPLGCFKLHHTDIFLSFWMVNKICDFRQ